MNLTGQNIIGFEYSRKDDNIFYAYNPSTVEQLPTAFYEATRSEVEAACEKAETAFETYRQKTPEERATFLEAIADEIMNLGDVLLERCHAETGLPITRLTGERGRTFNQLRLFAALLREGSWVDARIDHGDEERTPFPKPDVRQMQTALGPVGIFGASNFPLAFSVAGGDTASALAAGCTVVVKGHPAHPGTCELVGQAIVKATKKIGMPEGVFSLVQGPSPEVGLTIVQHPYIAAIGFTGSFKGGKAIFEAANRRFEPIPVYAEMGSTNPFFILPNALKERGGAIAKGLLQSVTLGTGQFCTNPGLTVIQNEEGAAEFEATLKAAFEATTSSVMLTKNIKDAYEAGIERQKTQRGVETLAIGQKEGLGIQGIPRILKVAASKFGMNNILEQEVFGPSTLLVVGEGREELIELVNSLEGHLTATIHGTEEDLETHQELIQLLERKVGRLIINGFPTGVEVCHAMVHGGPFPATTNSRMTSVGTAAITRFTRPICYQNFPAFLLPPALKDNNPLNIWRLVDGEWKK